MRSFGRKYGVSEDQLDQYCDRLVREVDRYVTVDDRASHIWTRSDYLEIPEQGHLAVFHMINRALWDDDEELLREAMPLIRGINRRCTENRGGPMPEIPECTYRCGSMPPKHIEFFERQAKSGEPFRFKPFFATSSSKQSAASFLARVEKPNLSAFWHVKYNECGCFHVNDFSVHSAYPDEKEFLFPPYSAFTVERVAKMADPEGYRIELRAVLDNQKVAEDLPLAPWS